MIFEPGTLEFQKPKTSVFRGVYWCSSKNKWRAEIEVNGLKFKLGRHELEINAARAYDTACIKFNVPERCNQWWSYTLPINTSARIDRRRRTTRLSRG